MSRPTSSAWIESVNGLLLENRVARHLTDMEVVSTYEGSCVPAPTLVGLTPQTSSTRCVKSGVFLHLSLLPKGRLGRQGTRVRALAVTARMRHARQPEAMPLMGGVRL
jgi:hypothetical protein